VPSITRTWAIAKSGAELLMKDLAGASEHAVNAVSAPATAAALS